MDAKSSQHLVEQYLKELRAASRGLSRGERRELAAQIEEHIRAALAIMPAPGEAGVREILERLGDPEEIVAEQYGPHGARAGIGAQAVTAIVLLLVGGFLAGIGWIAGVVLLWTSQVWTTREKLIGTLVVPGGLFGAFFVASALLVTSVGSALADRSPAASAARTRRCATWSRIAAAAPRRSSRSSTRSCSRS